MDVPALDGKGGDRATVEGRIESVREGAAQVRLSGGATVEVALERPLAEGTRVSVWTGSDGAPKVAPLGPDPAQALLRADLQRALEPLLGAELSSELSAPLARGDFSAAAQGLPTSAPPQTVPVGPAAPHPVFLSRPSPTMPPAGNVQVAVTSKLDAHTYSAEAAGRPWTLLGPSDVDPSARLISRAQPLPSGGAVWIPSVLGAGRELELPSMVQAGPEGARELLRWTGVSDATPDEVEDLGRSLARAAAELLEGKSQAVEDDAPSPASPPAAVGRIPSELAVRVLAAWSLELPSERAVDDAVLKRAVPEIPEALDSLERIVQERPGRHPALEAALDGIRRSARLPAGAETAADPRRVLESAVVDALSREPPGEDRDRLRQAAKSLLSDRLPESPADGGGRSFWTRTDSGTWDKARIVVRDRRDRGGPNAPGPGVHAVEIAMDPRGLGRVEARLELRGQILTTRFSASDPETVEAIRKGLPELRAAFCALGLEPGGLDVRPKAPVPPAPSRRSGAGGALDVRA